ncbi:MAG: sigma-70 family RNA polymerase sigma factor [Phycisphaerales bacterium]|nr:sigma-70 family RNA polymerase sigma factor [Phycisphaerales bacterium]
MSVDPIHIESAYPIIRAKAQQVCCWQGFRRRDLDDIIQEFWMHVLRRSTKFNPTRTKWETFVSVILDNLCISLLRHRRAAKRSSKREECSLNEPVRDADGRIVDRHQTTPEISSARTPNGGQDLQWDLQEFLALLPDELRATAIWLAHCTANSTCHSTGMSRRAIQRQALELREFLEDAGLRDYL